MGRKRKYMFDLFGKRVPIPTEKPKRTRQPNLTKAVTAKLTWEEYQDLCSIAEKFGVKPSRYCHDAIVRSIKEHEWNLNPSRPTDPGAVVLVKGPPFSKIHLPNLLSTQDISKMFG